ncbi:MAG: SAM-dependent methyltransferase [Myxococcales bacterium]|nr:SAM-dependent methyltransferase [Myxococcales bacterium]
MKLGTIYGVGVGPGAPDLITLRAIHVLRSVDVIAIPRKDRFSKSTAWRIARPNVGDVEGQERIFLHFPMTKDPAITKPAWRQAMDQVGQRLEAGK